MPGSQKPRWGPYLVGDIIDHDGSLCPPVVHRGQTVVSLLAGRIPDLKLYRCVIQADGLCKKCRCWEEQVALASH